MKLWTIFLLGFVTMLGMASCTIDNTSAATTNTTQADEKHVPILLTPLSTSVAWIPIMTSSDLTTPAATPINSPTPTASASPTLTDSQEPPSGALFAIRETAPILHQGDAADDPAIWIHPTDPALSVVIGTDKNGGLALYDLDGAEIQYLADGELNNVDLRDGFMLGGEPTTLVTAGNRTNNTIAVYKGNSNTRHLENVAAGTLNTSILSGIYGSCMYVSPQTGKYFFIGNDKKGRVAQYELFDDGNGLVAATLVRTFEVGSQTEGCVADDELGFLYVGEENVGIWKYGAEPDSGAERIFVDATGPGGNLVADVEGLTLYYGSNGNGFLIASSQGNDTYVVYRRQAANEYLSTFTIEAGNGIDGVTGTDGIVVTHRNLGPLFPGGLFVAHDGSNDDGNQNYKLVPWEVLANVAHLTDDR